MVRPDKFGGIKRKLEPLTDKVLFGIDSAKDAAKKVRDVAGGLTRPIGSVGRSVVEELRKPQRQDYNLLKVFLEQLEMH